MPCRRYLVEGLVQGVFFRASTQQMAQRLGLSGWVRNLTDGRVEVVARGEEAQLAMLEAWLHQGPPNARVQQVLVSEARAEDFDGFRVR